ncbi:MAG: biotin--[acetyl-CoA-carboxylase] ligase [Sulfurimonas sp.]|nr:biotin--[acetyl-CoA-carboxylase] ligase [Sulfurimonas sp.]
MKTTYLKTVGSTQSYLKELLKNKNLQFPHAVISDIQTDGIGSRDNSWKGMEGNLFLSFAIDLKDLPKDLKLESSSIYFAYLLKDVLNNLNSSVWLKWPNDFYIDDLKVGGMITNVVSNTIICGVGLNLVNSPNGFSILDITISKEQLVNKYFKIIEKKISWKQVFSKYKVEFHRNQNFFTHNNTLKISLGDANLQDDGSIIINGERIYSTR